MKILLYIFLLSCSTFCTQQTVIMTSANIPYADTVLITVPDIVFNAEKRPAVFLLHGWSGDFRQWNNITDLQKLADQYLCYIITPSGFFDSWYINSPLISNQQYQSYFMNELLALLVHSFPIDENNIYVSGLSMGGYGALSLLLNYPDRIKSAASTSGVLNLTSFPGKWGLEKILGDYEEFKDRYFKYSPAGILDTTSFIANKILIDCGTEDFAYAVNQEFYISAKTKKVDIHFISRPGAHTRKYWQESIPYHFLFFSQQFTSSPAEKK
ncbi:MAG: alpha/beta fold hydrolase [Ignavibacteriaceae bacterium]|nr:alpha/beta fold hydrolase [Ignavibacteriaceae bacterium]